MLVTMKLPQTLRDGSRKRLAHAKELHRDADAARQRSRERKQSAECAHATMARLREDATRWTSDASPLELAERHVAEAERHVEHQRKLLEVLIRDKHERMIGHAREVLEILEKSRNLAYAHLDLERGFQSRVK
jgi:hypothetical protein